MPIRKRPPPKDCPRTLGTVPRYCPRGESLFSEVPLDSISSSPSRIDSQTYRNYLKLKTCTGRDKNTAAVLVAATVSLISRQRYLIYSSSKLVGIDYVSALPSKRPKNRKLSDATDERI